MPSVCAARAGKFLLASHQGVARQQRKFLVHVWETSVHNVVELPHSFETFLVRFGTKHRNNLKDGSGFSASMPVAALELRRVTTKEDVPEFLRLASEVARRSWQSSYLSEDDQIRDSTEWQRDLADLADRGVLRCYLLMCGPRPCAFELAFQGYGCYHFHMTGYAPAFAQFSPGTVATYRS